MSTTTDNRFQDGLDFDALWGRPSSNRGHVSQKDGIVDLHGLQHSKITVAGAQVSGVLALHEEGGSYWVGRGMSAYAPAGYRVIRVEDVSAFAEGRTTRYVELQHFTPARNADERQSHSADLVRSLATFTREEG